MIGEQVEQSSTIRGDLRRNGSSNGNLTVTFIRSSNAQNLSKYTFFIRDTFVRDSAWIFVRN